MIFPQNIGGGIKEEEGDSLWTARRADNTMKPARTPLPWRELSVVLLVLATEAICFQFLFPFVPFMVRGFGVEEADVGFYAGRIASSFMVGQFFSSLFWGRMSDLIGLKPVMLIGMGCTAITVLLFGVSTSLEWALATRFVGGLFNGVIGVTKTYIGLITDETNEAQAFGFLALCWGIGGSVGPSLGGLLAQPALKYPHLFPTDSIWATHPYLLPCLVTSCIPITGFVMALAFLREPSRQNRSKKGVSSGASGSQELRTSASQAHAANDKTHPLSVATPPLQWNLIKNGACPNETFNLKADSVVGVMAIAKGGSVYATTHHLEPSTAGGGDVLTQHVVLLDDSTGIHTCGDADEKCCGGEDEGQEGCEGEERKRSAFAYAFAKKAVIGTSAYMLLRLAAIGLDDALPLLMSTPRGEGGMGFTSNEIGLALFGQGILLITHVLVIFPMMKERLGTLELFRLSALTVPLVCGMTPWLVDLQVHLPSWILWCVVEMYMAFKVFSLATGFTSVTILLNNSAPPHAIGTVNGCSQTGAAFSSMIAPALAGSLFSWSLQNDLKFPFDFHFTFFFFGLMSLGLLICSRIAPRSLGSRYVEEESLTAAA